MVIDLRVPRAAGRSIYVFDAGRRSDVDLIPNKNDPGDPATAPHHRRARSLNELEPLAAAGATAVVLEEGETGIALARHVLEGLKTDEETITKVLTAVRHVWRMDGNPAAGRGAKA